MKGRIIDRGYGLNQKLRLSLELDEPQELDPLVGVDLDITMKKYRKKRSLDANALYWATVGQLSQKVGIPANDIYRMHIRDMSVYETICMSEEAFPAFALRWGSGHMGRWAEIKAPSVEHPGYVWVLAYYGSSDFDTAQMSRLIDNLMQDCKEMGVELPPSESIQALLDDWEKAHAENRN